LQFPPPFWIWIVSQQGPKLGHHLSLQIQFLANSAPPRKHMQCVDKIAYFCPEVVVEEEDVGVYLCARCQLF